LKIFEIMINLKTINIRILEIIMILEIIIKLEEIIIKLEDYNDT